MGVFIWNIGFLWFIRIFSVVPNNYFHIGAKYCQNPTAQHSTWHFKIWQDICPWCIVTSLLQLEFFLRKIIFSQMLSFSNVAGNFTETEQLFFLKHHETPRTDNLGITPPLKFSVTEGIKTFSPLPALHVCLEWVVGRLISLVKVQSSWCSEKWAYLSSEGYKFETEKLEFWGHN